VLREKAGLKYKMICTSPCEDRYYLGQRVEKYMPKSVDE